jgi:hypothetical protein
MKRYRVEVDEDLIPLVPQFLVNRWEDTKKIRWAIESLDFERLAEIGHLFQGTPGCFGYSFLVRIGRDIEAAAKEKNFKLVKSRLHSLERFLDNHLIVEVLNRDSTLEGDAKNARSARVLNSREQRVIGEGAQVGQQG